MTFGKPRAIVMNQMCDHGTYELVRYASSVNVIGGFSKLLSFFTKNVSPNEIRSWADLRWVDPNNNVYLRNGFHVKSESKLGYFYTDLIKRYHRFGFLKSSNKDGYYLIYDAGQLNYSKKIY